MPDRSRRTHLRESTSEAHASLDRMIGSFDSPAAYRDYLRGISAFRSVVEGTLAAMARPEQFAGWQAETVSGLIAKDLHDLDLTPPQPVRAPELDESPEAFLGMLYVLEGSALGARVLCKRAQGLGFNAGFGARHLAVQSRRSERWPSFLALLESAAGIDMERVARASCATFQTAEQAFRQACHEPA